MSEENKFTILRASADGYQSIGPTAHRMTIAEALAAVESFKRRYPHQDFVIMGEIGEATMSNHVSVQLAAPNLGGEASNDQSADDVVLTFHRRRQEQVG